MKTINGLLLTITLLLICACKHQRKDALVANTLEPITVDTRLLGQKIDSFILNKMATQHLPGVAFVLVQNGQTIYKKGFGIADITTGKKVNVDSTIFRIGSVSKALTMFALTKLIDQGRLTYETPVKDHFSKVQNPLDLTDAIQTKHLLTHTAGLDQIGIGRQILDFDLSLEERKKKRPSLKAFLEAGNVRRIRPAGHYFTYDTYGSSLAGAIVEEVTGLPYAKAMEQLVFQPLGMQLSAVEVKKEYRQWLAGGHGYKEGTYFKTPYELYLTLPASSLDATVSDMGRLLEALTSNGSNSHGQLFSQTMMKKVASPQFRPHPEFVGMSHGLWEGNAFGTRPNAFRIRTLGHGGSMIGTSCNFNFTPELNLGMFIVANRNPESGGGRVAVWEIFNLVFEHLKIDKAAPFIVPKSKSGKRVSEYVGRYYHGVFCHTCSEAEFKKGAWRRGSPIEVQEENGLLVIGGENYFMREMDLFVRSDGKEMLYFGRDEKGTVTFFVSSEDATAYERMSS
ncbi:MAG: serine hydrolase domain-containing protein [Bacteroidota bacterium]